MLPKAILFDLDDTILSYHSLSSPTWNKVCAEFVAKNNLFEANTLIDAINETGKLYWSDSERHRLGRLDLNNTRREVVRLALEKLGCFQNEYAVQIADYYSNLHQESIHPFPGAVETLQELVQRGVRLALLTNGNSVKQRYKITKFDLEKYFDVCLVEEELGFGKPDIRVFQMALNHLRVSPGKTWMVGDNLEWDIETPQKMGIFSVWNDHDHSGLPEDSKIFPDRIINNISELLF